MGTKFHKHLPKCSMEKAEYFFFDIFITCMDTWYFLNEFPIGPKFLKILRNSRSLLKYKCDGSIVKRCSLFRLCKTVSMWVVHVCYRTCQYTMYWLSVNFSLYYTFSRLKIVKLTMKRVWWKTSYESTNVQKLRVSDFCFFVSNFGIHTPYHR